MGPSQIDDVPRANILHRKVDSSGSDYGVPAQHKILEHIPRYYLRAEPYYDPSCKDNFLDDPSSPPVRVQTDILEGIRESPTAIIELS